MAKLKKLGLDENTIVMFSSDNGPHKEGGHDAAFFQSSGGLNGIKRDLTDGGVREPFIVRWPGKIKPGTVSEHVSGFQDFLPTAADLAGVKVTAECDGISFLPTLLGNNAQQKQHPYLCWYFNEAGRQTRRAQVAVEAHPSQHRLRGRHPPSPPQRRRSPLTANRSSCNCSTWTATPPNPPTSRARTRRSSRNSTPSCSRLGANQNKTTRGPAQEYCPDESNQLHSMKRPTSSSRSPRCSWLRISPCRRRRQRPPGLMSFLSSPTMPVSTSASLRLSVGKDAEH